MTVSTFPSVTMEFVSSQAGQRKVLYKGHIYVKHEDLAHGMTSYECEKRRDNNCKAKIKVLREELVCLVNDHTHDVDAPCQEAATARQDTPRSAAYSPILGCSPQPAMPASHNTVETSHRKPEERHTKRAIRRCQRAGDGPQLALPLGPLVTTGAEGQQLTNADGECPLLYDSDTDDSQTARTAVEAVSRSIRRNSKYCRMF